MKKVQIDIDLFYDLLDYFYPDSEFQNKDILFDKIRIKLGDKVDKMIAHDLFAEYKRTPTGVEREQARRTYIEHKGIFKDYQTTQEYHTPEPDKK